MIDELIKQAQKGNINAFEEIILGYKNILYKIAKTRLSNIDDIEDAVQETIISAYQSIYQLRDITKFKSWIITILINKCNRINKKKSKQNLSYEEIDIEKYVGRYDVSTTIGFDELISFLSKDEKTIMTLFYSEDYTAKEISKILKLNENTVRRKISEARKKIEKKIKEVEAYE